MTASLACPYCNSTVTVPAGTAAGQRVTCPRCGDAFTLRESVPAADDAIQTGASQTGVQLAPERAPPDVGRRRWSNRTVGATVLGFMVFMAMAGLALALWTVKDRRAHDTGLKARPHRPLAPPFEAPAEPPAAAVAPDKLEALGYLPPGTDVVAALHMAELLALPAGQQLLRQPIPIGGGQYQAETLAGWTGLRPEDLDHLVVGMKMDESVPPRVLLVARTRAPFDRDQLRSRLAGERLANASKKGTFLFWSPGRQVQLAMYCPDDRTAVVAPLSADHLQAVPDRPVADLEQLPEKLREVLRQRRELGSPAWLAGHVEDWARSPTKWVLPRLKKEAADRLTSLRTFAVFVQLERGLTVKAALRCKDAAAARALDDYLHGLPWAAKASWKTALDGPWLNVQVQTDLAALR
jgi:uncharacterized protein YbaR (Trm112 family)